jgi:transposase
MDMSADVPLPDQSSKPLKVSVTPAAGVVVLPSADPDAATVQVPVRRVPAGQLPQEQGRPLLGTPLPNPVAPTAAPSATIPSLPDDPALLKQMILELLATLQETRQEREQLQQRLHLLLQRLYGPRTERFNPNQPSLFADIKEAAPETPQTSADAATPAAEDDAKSNKPARKHTAHGRKQPPKDLPRVPVHHTLSAAELLCPSCGTPRVEIGTQTTAQLNYRPASLFVAEHIEHKYACPCCSKQGQPHIVAGQKPEQPLGKGSPGAGLLAYLIVNKYADHLPLYRQERILQRQGLGVARSTTCDWMAQAARKLHPLYDRMRRVVLASRVIHTDDTPVKRRDAADDETRQSRLWGYLGDAEHPYNVFDFTINRKRDGPQQFLQGYVGYLQADAFSGYDCLYLPEPQTGMARIQEVACNAHARRKFYEARTSNASAAHQALAYYRQLYEIERQAKDVSEEVRLQMRQDLAVPILDKMHTWLEQVQQELLPKDPFREATNYALNQWRALCRYTSAGFLAIDNNGAEREMKRIAIGRKNWLFFGSAQGGKTAAVLFTFTSTCHRLAINPWAYLQDVLTRLPTTPNEQLVDLLPDRWQAAQARPAP